MNNNSQVKVFSNYFRMSLTQNVVKYNIGVDSPQEIDRNQVIKDCLFRNKDNKQKLVGLFGDYFKYLNGSLYSVQLVDQTLSFNHTISNENGANMEVVITIEQDSNCITCNDPIAKNLTGYLTKNLQSMLKYKQIGRNLFNPDRAVTVEMFEVWPGYATSFIPGESSNSLLNIDLVSKVITQVNVLSFMLNLRQKCSHDFENLISSELEGKSVMTKYNRKIYRVDRVEFKMNPSNKFKKQDGSEISFCEYYQTQYKINVTMPQQPLLVHIDRKKGEVDKEIYLLPELCVMTGLTDEQRADRRIMGNLDKVIKPQAGERLKRCSELIEAFATNPKTKQLMDEWRLKIDMTPVQVTGVKINSGNLLFTGKNINIENCQNLDRDGQQKMFRSKNFTQVVVFYPGRNKREFQTFMQNFTDAVNQYAIQVADTKTVEIDDFRNFNEIKEKAEKNLSPQSNICIWILPGAKKQGTNYDKIKRLLINNLPVPSQMILTSTIAAGKNLRSIITKLLVQIGAKVGAVPWAIDDLPFSNEPTMVVGIDCYTKNAGSKALPAYAMVATINNTYSTYWSNSVFGDGGLKIEDFIATNLFTAIEKFKLDNTIYPKNIIILREGISEGQRASVKLTEVAKVREVIDKIRGEDKKNMNFVYVCLSKTCNAKFFYTFNGNLDFNQLQNPPQGTYLYKDICSRPEEFYLVCQKTFRGLASPTSYYILENELTTNRGLDMTYVKDNVAKLSFKLSFMYYNTIGAIKIPAPIHYAHKLSSLLSDRSSGNERIIPHAHLGIIQSLYFI